MCPRRSRSSSSWVSDLAATKVGVHRRWQVRSHRDRHQGRRGCKSSRRKRCCKPSDCPTSEGVLGWTRRASLTDRQRLSVSATTCEPTWSVYARRHRGLLQLAHVAGAQGVVAAETIATGWELWRRAIGCCRARRSVNGVASLRRAHRGSSTTKGYDVVVADSRSRRPTPRHGVGDPSGFVSCWPTPSTASCWVGTLVGTWPAAAGAHAGTGVGLTASEAGSQRPHPPNDV